MGLAVGRDVYVSHLEHPSKRELSCGKGLICGSSRTSEQKGLVSHLGHQYNRKLGCGIFRPGSHLPLKYIL